MHPKMFANRKNIQLKIRHCWLTVYLKRCKKIRESSLIYYKFNDIY